MKYFFLTLTISDEYVGPKINIQHSTPLFTVKLRDVLLSLLFTPITSVWLSEDPFRSLILRITILWRL